MFCRLCPNLRHNLQNTGQFQRHLFCTTLPDIWFPKTFTKVTVPLGSSGKPCRFESCCPHQKGDTKKMYAPKTLILSGFFACLGPKKVHGSFIDAKPDFWPYVGPEVATAHFSPNFESDFRKYIKDFSAAAVSMRSQERFFYSDQGSPPSPLVLKFFLTASGSVPPE